MAIFSLYCTKVTDSNVFFIRTTTIQLECSTQTDQGALAVKQIDTNKQKVVSIVNINANK